MPHRFRLYILPFIGGSLLGVGLYFAVQNSGFLATNIAGTPLGTETVSDVSVVVDEQARTLSLVTDKELPDTDSITLLVTYDPETVTMTPADITSSYPVYPANIQEGQYMITIQELGILSQKTTLVTISPQGDTNQVTLSDVVIHFTDGTSTRLAVEVPSF